MISAFIVRSLESIIFNLHMRGSESFVRMGPTLTTRGGRELVAVVEQVDLRLYCSQRDKAGVFTIRSTYSLVDINITPNESC